MTPSSLEGTKHAVLTHVSDYCNHERKTRRGGGATVQYTWPSWQHNICETGLPILQFGSEFLAILISEDDPLTLIQSVNSVQTSSLAWCAIVSIWLDDVAFSSRSAPPSVPVP